MTLFEFVTVMISMILAISLGHLLDGLSWLFKSRHRVRGHLPHSLWVGGLLLTLVNHWWAVWDLSSLNWNYASFLYVLIAPIFLGLAVGVIAPDRPDAGQIDLVEQFARARKPFALAMFAYLLAMWFDGPLFAGQPVFGLVGLLHIPGIVAAVIAFWSKGHITNVVAGGVSVLVVLAIIGVRLSAAVS